MYINTVAACVILGDVCLFCFIFLAADNVSIATERSLAYSAYLRYSSPDPTYSTFHDSDSEVCK